MRPRLNVLALCAAALLSFAAAFPAFGQAGYPSRLITLIVPFAAGGPTDIVARLIAENRSRTLGQQIVIENVLGTGGTTAAVRAMRAPPDGYTIMMGHMGTHAAAVALYPRLPYNPSVDFEPIGMVVGMPVLVLVRKDLPVRDLKEFAAYAAHEPGQLKMAHAGNGSVAYTTCLLLNSLIDARPELVAFQGTGPAMNALIAGRVDYMCDQVVSVVPQAQAGSVRALAIATPRRNQALPEVPTSGEGGVPEFQATAWNALFAPRGTPKPVIATLNAALGAALEAGTVRSRLLGLGSEIPERENRSPEALARLVASEITRWKAMLTPPAGH